MKIYRGPPLAALLFVLPINLRILLQTDPEVKAAFERLSEQGQEELLEISDKKRVPNLLSDTIFKTIFDPDVKDSLLSDFISCILGRKSRCSIP